MKKPTLRWRREPRATGLAAVTQLTRDHELWYGNVRVATLSPWAPPGLGNRDPRGYYWYCGSNEEFGIKHVNTYCASGPDWEDHQLKEAKAFVRSKIKQMMEEKAQHGKDN